MLIAGHTYCFMQANYCPTIYLVVLYVSSRFNNFSTDVNPYYFYVKSINIMLLFENHSLKLAIWICILIDIQSIIKSWASVITNLILKNLKT